MSTAPLHSKSVTITQLNAARVSVATGILFVLLLGSLHLLEKEFDPTWRFISEYALGRFGWLMPLAFLALAICLAAIGVAVFPQTRSIVGYLGLAALALAVIGLCIAAAFKTDPITTPMEDLSPSGKMHVLGASFDYSPLAFLLLSFSLARVQAWQPNRKRLFITAAISLILTVGFILAIPQNGVFGPGVYTGLIGRFLLLSYLAWIGTTALFTIKLHSLQS